MSVDKNTKPSYLSITFEDNDEFKAILKEGRKLAEDEGQNSAEDKSIYLRPNNLDIEEYYYDADDNEINISCLFGKNNDSLYLSIPLSDEILIDILSAGIKKFNKLKLALETLK